MSNIKDFFAEVENIDDLKPIKKPIKVRTYAEQLEDIVLEKIKAKEAREYLQQHAEFSFDEEGWYWENFLELCDDLATDALDEYIEDQHLDLSDETYKEIIAVVRDRVSDIFATFEADYIREAMEDAKYKLDELRERNGQC